MKEQKNTQRGTTYEETKSGEVVERKVDASSEKDDDHPPDDPNLLAHIEGNSEDSENTPHLDKQFQEILSSLHNHHTKEEVDAIMSTVEREREEVIKIMKNEGGVLEDVIAHV